MDVICRRIFVQMILKTKQALDITLLSNTFNISFLLATRITFCMDEIFTYIDGQV